MGVVSKPLALLRVADLYLACACVSGDPVALALFEKRCLADVGQRLPGGDETNAAEGEAGAAPQALRSIRRPAGPRSPTTRDGAISRVGFCVAATRTSLNLARSRRRERPLDEDALLAQRAGTASPEMDHLQRVYAGEFEAAFRIALDSLDPRDKTMLRQHYVDGLAMEQIAAIYRVHRLTVLRRMKAARTELATETRRQLVKRLRVSKTELESIMRFVRSRLDITLRSYLADSGEV